MKSRFLAVSFLVLSTGQPATAQELDEASVKVFSEAIKAFDKKDWAVCRTKAIGVWQQNKSPKVAGILGMCEAELALNAPAAEHLEYFFKNQKGSTEAQLAQAKERLDKVRGKVALITITPKPAGAEVSVNGVVMGKGAQTLFVEKGTVEVTASMGGQSRSRTIVVDKDGQSFEAEAPADPSIGGTGGDGGAGGTGGAGGDGGAGGQGASGQGAGGSGPTPDGRATGPSVAFGLTGGVGLALFGGLLAGAFVMKADADDTLGSVKCTANQALCDDVNGTLDTANLLGTLSFVGLAVGVAGFTGLGLWLGLPVSGSSGAAAGARVGLGSLVLEGSF